MDEMSGDSARSEQGNTSTTWWPSDFIDNLQSVSLDSREETTCNIRKAEVLSQTASQILWSTGTFSASIPNGFYSVIPDRKIKELFSTIPSPDDLHSLGMEGFKADIILVDAEKDKKLSILKQLSAAMVKGLHNNPALLIKKIACLGLPSDGGIECADSYKHMSVVVVLNSVELLVDLMRFPGQLIPFSTKAIFISHISAAGESDSAENDSCDSPLEPNSPLCGLPDKGEADGCEQDDNNHSLYQRVDGSSSGQSLRNIVLRSTTFTKGRLSVSHSEPDIANALAGCNQRKTVAEQQHTASSSPEHPLSRARGWSMLSGDRQTFRECTDNADASRSDGASTFNARRIRRRSISITPEIGDDIVRAVRAMNETLKQNRLLKDLGDDGSCSFSTNDQNQLNNPLNKDEISFKHSKQTGSSQKAISLPSSPHEYSGKSPERNRDSPRTEAMLSTWNNVLQSSPFLTKPLIPFEEWNIDFSELTVGTRVGIGFFGEVFRGIWNGTDVAIKVFLEQDLTTENMEDFCNEIYILSRLRHPNVILFLGACMKPPHLSMVTEYMEMGSLYYLIHMSGQKKKLSWRKRLKMLRDICRGLMCIHRMKIVHRDLKSANCLVDKHWAVKICDFGLSRIITDGPLRDNSSAGTPEWMAPELIRNEPFTEKCDIFSLGVIMWELCTLNRPWDGTPPVQVIYAVANEGTGLEIPEGPLGKLIADCWAEPDERPSCQEILTRLLDCEYTLS
ncbi:RAF proto-oncogene serine/threonine-protein kinase-like isoform X5 [Zingiber officinale]|uniref:RAF proto-oncogene serine/threonine-protein kinase-like isoform X5 n=1 Tax=Zingiber officinale TaxID=94328 RepID=UPI001C4B806D|nr:RAF proto-oncogene serine/threonine-protein kinase-like isoform X5 [Zingiber officinale]